MSGRPFLHHGQRIASGPVHDRLSPLDIATAGWIVVGCCVAVLVWCAWGCGLPVGETRK
jgi:hypothetical protein